VTIRVWGFAQRLTCTIAQACEAAQERYQEKSHTGKIRRTTTKTKMQVKPVVVDENERWQMGADVRLVPLQGYCLGALMAFITAARHEVDAAVAYHGGDTEKYLGEVGSLRAPLLMHLGEEDEVISKTAQAQIKAALARKPNATVYSYPGQRHAFSRHNGAHYSAAAATLANGQTKEFRRRHLR
jgi:dienelactone hydrolase